MIGRRSTPDLDTRLDALGRAVDLADGRLPDAPVVLARHVIDKAEGRRRHGAELTVAALLGSTGAGKSSLLNALTDSTVATAGVRRPTTTSTLAAVWGDDDHRRAAGPLLDWLEIDTRHQVDGGGASLDGLVVLDVPDHDSVQVEHRLEMERIAEHADLLVWVTDPEKYADATLHAYLRDLDGHGAVMLVALNKVDRLSPDEADACLADLRRLLADHGMPHTPVLGVSAAADGGAGPLREALAATVADRRVMIDRLTADAVLAAEELWAAAGGESARPGRSDDRRAADDLADELARGAGIDAVADAVAAGIRRDAAGAMGWPFTRWIRGLRPHPLRRLHLGSGTAGRSSRPAPAGVTTLRAGAAVRDYTDRVTADLTAPWPAAVAAAATPAPDRLADRLDVAVAEAARTSTAATPRWWSILGVLQLALAAATTVGFVWLTVLFALRWLAVPDPPTPEWRGWPIPTLLLIGGVVIGLVVAAIGRRLGGLSARRAAAATRRRAREHVAEVVDELVVEPTRSELARARELHDLLETATHR